MNDVELLCRAEVRRKGNRHQTIVSTHPANDALQIQKQFRCGNRCIVRQYVDGTSLRGDEEPICAIPSMGDLNRAIDSQVLKRRLDIDQGQWLG